MNESFAVACNETAPDARFIVTANQRPASLTFREVRVAALRLAAGLRRLGVEAGVPVAMQLPNWLEACTCYHACCVLGAPLVPILHLYRPDEVLRIVDRSKARVLIVPASWMGLDYSPTVEKILARSTTISRVVVVGDSRPIGDGRVLAFDEVQASPPLSEGDCASDPDAPSIIAFTSGITGEPKGVVHSQRSIIAATNAMVAAFGGAEPHREVGMNPNPVGHGTGLFVTFVLPFLHRFRAMLLLDRWDPDEMLMLMEEHGVTVAGGAPVFLSAMLRTRSFSARNTSSLRGFILGGDVVAPSLVQLADRSGWRALRAYGLTEQPSISMGSPEDSLADRAETDGRVVERTGIRIVDEKGTLLPRGLIGEIQVRGPGQCIGLLAADSIEPATEDGWLHTGDLGELDGRDRVTIRGRVKDLIIRGGEKISCSEVEAVLLQHPAVVDAAVVGEPHPLMGQQVAAFVVTRRGSAPDTRSVIRHCLEAALADHKVPKRLRVIDAVPRSVLGKVQRYRLIEPGSVEQAPR